MYAHNYSIACNLQRIHIHKIYMSITISLTIYTSLELSSTDKCDILDSQVISLNIVYLLSYIL